MAADRPYAGKWKLNRAKSDFGDSTLTNEELPGGEMKQTTDGLSYSGPMWPAGWTCATTEKIKAVCERR